MLTTFANTITPIFGELHLHRRRVLDACDHHLGGLALGSPLRCWLFLIPRPAKSVPQIASLRISAT